ncbi:cytosolic phospholipase A2 epsilon-like isoform X2 [Rhineura floridana]|uniref:cytosolic phospholipase A2 epsilon-like isoform X2 n=1 Tax=Rhineura floridana TaxID=261503 RepID=UPI002AC81066|nr:cytosolic phospholipase A2 epsilon-like isoform X2 [Rhineura floridana]
MEAYGRLSTLAEVSPCYLLKVRVIRARNLRRADSLNHTDCYLILWLPTASSVQFQTKTVQNSKDPVWNETFHFTVQSKAKNILELGVYDEDACQDEHLFTVCFDIAGLPLNERVLMTFHSNPKDHEELDVEFELRNALSAPETIITNGVLLSRQVCSLEFDVQKKKRQNSKHGLSLMVKGSHEGHQEYSFGSDSCVRPSYQSSFHYIKYKHPALDVKIPKKDLDYAFGPCSYNKEKRSLKVEINSIPTSKKIVLTENNQFALHVKTEDCQTGLDVRLEYGLCTQEQDFLNKRKNIVAGALKKVLRLGKDLQDHEKDNHKLSDQQQAVNEGQNPLPIYTAINVKEKYSTIDFKEWVEFTPYEVGILKYGAFVRAEDFGSEFFMGRLMKRLPETRICYMQGMWSSIFSLNLLYFWNTSHSSEDFWHKWTQDQIADIDEEPHLPTRPHEQKTHLYTPAGPLSSAFRNVLTDRLSVAQYHNFLRGLQLNNSYLENDTFHRWKDTVLDSSSPNQLTQTEDYLSLIDTGFFINTSSAPLLRKERKVDVIIHLNYSAGSQSLPLKQSCKYYAEQGIPFPKAVLSEDDKHLKECYLFDDVENLEAPILVFFPQVNDTFRYYKAPGVKRSESEMKEGKVDVSSNCTPYSTYSLTFSKEEFDQLVELSEYNILNNQHLIMQALHTAVERKKTLK